MSKKLLVLNALFALMLVACQPASRKQKGTTGAQTGVEETKKEDNSDADSDANVIEATAEGKIVKRSSEPLAKMEVVRAENTGLKLIFTLEPKEIDDAKKSKIRVYEIHVKHYGPNREKVDEKSTIQPGHTKYYPVLESIFSGKQALVPKAIDPKLMGAGELSLRLFPLKNVSDPLIVREPTLESGSATFFQDLVARIHVMMKARARKAAGTMTAIEAKDLAICEKIDLKGGWKSVTKSGDLSREMVTTLEEKQKANGFIEYAGANEITEQSEFGEPKVTKETAKYGYDPKTCRIIEDRAGQKAAYLLNGYEMSSKGTGETWISAIRLLQCKDDRCAEPLAGAEAIELRREPAQK